MKGRIFICKLLECYHASLLYLALLNFPVSKNLKESNLTIESAKLFFSFFAMASRLSKLCYSLEAKT